MARKKKETIIDPNVPGTASQIMMNYAEGHYAKVYNDKGEIEFLDKNRNTSFPIPEEVRYYMELLIGYETLEAYY